MEFGNLVTQENLVIHGNLATHANLVTYGNYDLICQREWVVTKKSASNMNLVVGAQMYKTKRKLLLPTLLSNRDA